MPKFKDFIAIMEKIDELDRKILKIITQSARTPFKEVAEQCGVSRAAVHQRVQKMFDNGVTSRRSRRSPRSWRRNIHWVHSDSLLKCMRAIMSTYCSC